MSRRPPLPGGPYLIVGLGRSGIAAGLALRARGEAVIAMDTGSPDVRALSGIGGIGGNAGGGGGGEIETHLGTDGVDLLGGTRTLIKSPGVPADAPVVALARARGMSVIGELEMAWRLLDNDFVGVTGTNGKTTTVELIGEIHREAGLEVVVAGNVGLALSTLLDPGAAEGLDRRATIVCEASSFQLEDAVEFAPEAAVLLNLSDDHLDRHGSMESYRAAKLQIFARQRPDDIAVAPEDLPIPGGEARRVRFGASRQADLGERDGSLWWGETALLGVDEIRLRGLHNRRNAMAAAAVTLARGLPIEAVRGALRSFRGVPHRLEEVASAEGVVYVNDSKATNVAGTLVALESFPRGSVHLILGGQGKGQDFEPLRAAVADRCAGVYLIGEDAPRIAAALGDGLPVRRSDTLERAVAQARAAAVRPGDVVLLSPACASFDQFADFEDRGRRFRELVGAG